jgi:predicted RNase H-like nuclease
MLLAGADGCRSGWLVTFWNIGGKIREVDTWLQKHPKDNHRLSESSPELCFKMLNNGEKILEKKSSEEGIQIREELIRNQGNGFMDLYLRIKKTVPFKLAKPDDMLDALSLLSCNQKGLENGYSFLEDHNPVDKKGIKIRIAF